MRVLVSLIVASVISLFGASAQESPEAYFCVQDGTRLEYVRSNISSGRTVWLQTMVIGPVSANPDGSMKVGYSSDVRKSGGRSGHTDPVHLSVTVGRGADVRMNVAESLAAIIRNMLPDKMVSSEGGETMLNASAIAGEQLPDVVCKVSAGPVKLTISSVERVVDRFETIETAAGKFDCMVIRERRLVSGPFREDKVTYTWYARGVGMVRHDTIFHNKPSKSTSEVLVSIAQ